MDIKLFIGQMAVYVLPALLIVLLIVKLIIEAITPGNSFFYNEKYQIKNTFQPIIKGRKRLSNRLSISVLFVLLIWLPFIFLYSLI